MSPAYTDFKPTMKQQREDRRQKIKLLLSILPAVIVAIAYLVWRFL